MEATGTEAEKQLQLLWEVMPQLPHLQLDVPLFPLHQEYSFTDALIMPNGIMSMPQQQTPQQAPKQQEPISHYSYPTTGKRNSNGKKRNSKPNSKDDASSGAPKRHDPTLNQPKTKVSISFKNIAAGFTRANHNPHANSTTSDHNTGITALPQATPHQESAADAFERAKLKVDLKSRLMQRVAEKVGCGSSSGAAIGMMPASAFMYSTQQQYSQETLINDADSPRGVSRGDSSGSLGSTISGFDSPVKLGMLRLGVIEEEKLLGSTGHTGGKGSKKVGKRDKSKKPTRKSQNEYEGETDLATADDQPAPQESTPPPLQPSMHASLPPIYTAFTAPPVFQEPTPFSASAFPFHLYLPAVAMPLSPDLEVDGDSKRHQLPSRKNSFTSVSHPAAPATQRQLSLGSLFYPTLQSQLSNRALLSQLGFSSAALFGDGTPSLTSKTECPDPKDKVEPEDKKGNINDDLTGNVAQWAAAFWGPTQPQQQSQNCLDGTVERPQSLFKNASLSFLFPIMAFDNDGSVPDPEVPGSGRDCKRKRPSLKGKECVVEGQDQDAELPVEENCSETRGKKLYRGFSGISLGNGASHLFVPIPPEQLLQMQQQHLQTRSEQQEQQIQPNATDQGNQAKLVAPLVSSLSSLELWKQTPDGKGVFTPLLGLASLPTDWMATFNDNNAVASCEAQQQQHQMIQRFLAELQNTNLAADTGTGTSTKDSNSSSNSTRSPTHGVFFGLPIGSHSPSSLGGFC